MSNSPSLHGEPVFSTPFPCDDVYVREHRASPISTWHRKHTNVAHTPATTGGARWGLEYTRNARTILLFRLGEGLFSSNSCPQYCCPCSLCFEAKISVCAVLHLSMWCIIHTFALRSLYAMCMHVSVSIQACHETMQLLWSILVR